MKKIRLKLLKKRIQLTLLKNRLLLTTRRMVMLSMSCALLISTVLSPAIIEKLVASNYVLAQHQKDLIGEVNPNLVEKLKYDEENLIYTFNDEAKPVDENITPEDMTPEKLKAISGGDEAQSNQYALDVHKKGKDGITIYDSNLKLSFRMKPQFDIGIGRQIDGRLIYPMKGATAVYTTKGNGLKEDILFEKAPKGGSVSYGYDLELPKELEARLNKDGSIGIYSADPMLFGNISYGDDSDKMKMQSARETAEKNHLVFNIPAPVIITKSSDIGKSRTWFELRNNVLTINARDLDTIHEPFSLDPTVVVTSSSDFKMGNDEGGTTFGTDQISRAQITGGSTGVWTSNPTSFSTGRYGHTSVTYNGYLYIIGGYGGAGSQLNSVEYAPINSNGTIGAWNTTTSFTAGRNGHTSVAYNGFLYVLGGFDDNYYNDVQYAPINSNGTVGAWNPTSSFSTSRTGHASVVYNGYLYISGGTDSGLASLGDVQYAPINANGTIGSWTATTSLTTSRSRHAMVVYNNYIYALGGSSMTGVQYAPINANGTIGSWTATTSLTSSVTGIKSVIYSGYIYVISSSNTAINYAPINANGTIGSWTATTNFTTGRDDPTMVSYNGYLYILGGDDGTNFLKDVQYSQIDEPGTTGSYAFSTTLPSRSCGILCTETGLSELSVVSYNGYIYAIGGRDSDTWVDTVFYATINANGTLGTWAATTALPAPRVQVATAVYNGYLYVIGGRNETSTIMSTVYYAAINANGTLGSWTVGGSLSPGRASASAVAHNGYLYVSGGQLSTASTACHSESSFYCSTVAMNTIGATGGFTTSWSTTTAMPTTKRFHKLLVIGERMYSIGGTNDGGAGNINLSTSINATTGALSSWTGVTDNMQSSSGDAVFYKGYFYMTGGISSSVGVWSSRLNTDGSLSSWRSLADTNQSRYHHGMAVHNDVLYMVGGRAGNAVSTTALDSTSYAFINNGGSGTTGTFAATTDLSAARSSHASVAYNNYVYVLGGYDTVTTTVTNNVLYAPLNSNGTIPNGSWNSTTSFTTGRYGLRAEVYNGYIYVIGGHNAAGSYLNDIQFAPINGDGSLGTWQYTHNSASSANQVGGFTTPRHSHASVAHRGYLYVIGGFSPTQLTSIQYAPLNTNGTIGTWASTTNLPVGTSNLAAVAANGYMYVLGGTDGTNRFNDVRYAVINSNGTLGSWITTNSFKLGRSSPGAVVHNGNIYLLGGTDSGTHYNDVQYTPINPSGGLGEWNTTASFTTGRYDHTSVAYNGYLYVIGGQTTGLLTSVQYSKMNSMPRKARYSKLIDFGTSGNLSNITFGGTLSEGKPNISFRIAGTDGIFGAQANAAELTGACSAYTGRYVLVTITIDDAYLSVYPDSTYQGSLQDLTTTYATIGGAAISPDVRLSRGKHFSSQSLQPLDTIKSLTSSGCS